MLKRGQSSRKGFMHGWLMGLLVMLLLPLRAGEVKLVSFNIRYEASQDRGWKAWTQRLPHVLAVIRAMNPDVLGVQEALHGQVEALRQDLPEYEFYGVGRDDGKTKGEYSGVFYRKERFRADLSDAGTFWLSDTPETPGSKTWGNEIPRIATWLHLVEISSGKGFTVFNTHWDHQHQGSRMKAAQLIAKRMDERRRVEEPVLLLGDFNATEGNPAMDYLAGRKTTKEAVEVWSKPLVDTYHSLHPQEKNRRTFNDWKSDRTGWLKLDHILCSSSCKVLSAEIVYPTHGQNPPSDHFPVTAVITW